MNNELIIGIAQETRFFICQQLNAVVARQFLLYIKFLNYHWNVKGPHFGPLHLLFRQGYELLFESIDETAERIVQLGFPALGTIKDFSLLAPEKNTLSHDAPSSKMVHDLVNDFQALIIFVREVTLQVEGNHYHDSATANFLAEMLEKYEKYLWMLRSHIL